MVKKGDMQALILYIQSTSKIAWWWNPHTPYFLHSTKSQIALLTITNRKVWKKFLLSFLKNQIESFPWLIKIDFENYHRQKNFFLVLCWNWKKFFLLFLKNQISKFFWVEQNRFWKIFKRKKIFFYCFWKNRFKATPHISRKILKVKKNTRHISRVW